MPMHTYPSWVVHIPKMGTVASTCWTQRVPQKLFTDGLTGRVNPVCPPHLRWGRIKTEQNGQKIGEKQCDNTSS